MEIQRSQFPHPIADAYLKELQAVAEAEQKKLKQEKEVVMDVSELEQEAGAPVVPPPTDDTAPCNTSRLPDESQKDTPDVPLRPAEKKRLHWKGKTCLSIPLPFKH